MKKDLYIDADHILYKCIFSATKKSGFEKDECDEDVDDGLSEYIVNPTIDISGDITMFKDKVEHYTNMAMVECTMRGWKFGEVYTVLGGSDNFRTKIDPYYKSDRPEKTEEFIKLREWARSEYMEAPKGFECDDFVSWHVYNGNIGVTEDKDLFKNVKGLWYDARHDVWINRTGRSARRHLLLQSVAGDSTDGIKGIPGVAFAKGEKLLNKYGWCWNGVVRSYESKGMTIIDAIKTRRLVDVMQYSPNGLSLFKPDNVNLIHNFGVNDTDDSTSYCYKNWVRILDRCYVAIETNELPSNRRTMCDEWLLFSNFKRWYEGTGHSGDVRTNRLMSTTPLIYSPETCSVM